ncbi:hypothetical protein PpBr36_02494 [Pyricularia pennisetigena]|uniref:hypothetical protein n=1 Tax=Pyricularia pennisetigena TaxID=1578925 RepID=UPI0011506263|nr:hypothetical protein PpBr36_02494 [Pyricularia pennisetigena]TLS31413.1 hypothetical protein PpBr36_02494 [Pyricularia pennisetigena]
MWLSALLLLALGATARAQDRTREHVALCDCRNGADVVSSQMAYYLGEPDSTPVDVATVPNTPNGQARVWPSATTSAFFTLTNVTFTAKLGPQVEVGAFAGTGTNGWPAPFNCWFRPTQKLYVYDGWECAMVYDCSHDAANSTTPSTTTGATTGRPTRSATQTDSSGISTPALIGVAVGSGVVAIIVIGAVGFVCVHRRRAREARRQLEEQRLQSPPKSPYGGVFDAEGRWHQTVKPGPPQEMDGQYRGLEVHAGPTGGYREIDSRAVKAEVSGNRPHSSLYRG